MNIVWLVNNYPNKYNDFTGGLFFERMANELAKRDVTLKIIQPVPLVFWPLSKFKKYENISKLSQFEKRNNIEIYRPRYLAFPRQYYLGFVHWMIYFSLLKYKFWDKIDIVDAKYSYPNGSVANLLKKKFGIKSIISCIGSDVNNDVIESKVNKILQIKNFKLADNIICVNEELGLQVEHLSGKSFEVVHDGVSLDSLNLVEKRHDNKIKCIYIGELSNAKGTHVIYSLFEQFPEYSQPPFEWHIIGQGTSDFGLSKFRNVILYGRLENIDALNHLNQCQYLVFPSLFEGLPNVLKEAALLKVPIIASNVGGIPSFLGNGTRGYIFESENIIDLDQKIKTAIKDENRTKGMTIELFNYTIDNFGVRKNVDKLIHIYKITSK